MNALLLLVAGYVLWPTGQGQSSQPSFLGRSDIRGPSLVVFLKHGCPCNERCAKDLNALNDGLRGKAALVGVVDADARSALEYGKKLNLRFALLPDPQRKSVRLAGAECSLDLALLTKEGKLDKLWPGYSREILGELLGRLRAEGIEASLDLEAFPKRTQSGCRFPPFAKEK